MRSRRAPGVAASAWSCPACADAPARRQGKWRRQARGCSPRLEKSFSRQISAAAKGRPVLNVERANFSRGGAAAWRTTGRRRRGERPAKKLPAPRAVQAHRVSEGRPPARHLRSPCCNRRPDGLSPGQPVRNVPPSPPWRRSAWPRQSPAASPRAKTAARKAASIASTST